MSTFANARDAKSRVPEDHVILDITAFAADWKQKPQGEVALGLRRVSDGDLQTARAEAAKYATMMHDDREGQIESFNDGLMRWMIVRGTCDANDILLNNPIFDGSEENVRNALTSNAIRYVWDRIEQFHVAHSPLVEEATLEDLDELASRMRNPHPLEKMSPAVQKRFMKFAWFLLNELRTVDPNYVEDTLDPIEEEVEVG